MILKDLLDIFNHTFDLKGNAVVIKKRQKHLTLLYAYGIIW